jgi:hypothetical protein
MEKRGTTVGRKDMEYDVIGSEKEIWGAEKAGRREGGREDLR